MGDRREGKGALPWAPAGGGGKGGTCPPLEFEKMTSYAAVLQNTLKFSLAPTALALDTLYFSLKRREKTQKFSFAPYIYTRFVREKVTFEKTRHLNRLV